MKEFWFFQEKINFDKIRMWTRRYIGADTKKIVYTEKFVYERVNIKFTAAVNLTDLLIKIEIILSYLSKAL